MDETKKAFDRGLSGKSLMTFLDVFDPFNAGPTPAEEKAYERGREAKAVLDELEKRSEK